MQRTGATITKLPRSPFDPTGPDGRLAELVAHLTGCDATLAVDAVEHALPDDRPELSLDDRLGVVARAVVLVKKEQGLDLRDHRGERRVS